MCVLSHSVVSDSVTPQLWPARLLCPWDSPGKNTGVGCRALLQGIFPTQGSNPGSPESQAYSLPAEPPGKPLAQAFLDLLQSAHSNSCTFSEAHTPQTLPQSRNNLNACPAAQSTSDVGDAGLIPGLGRSPGGGHGNPLQDSCLENPMDRGAWRATVQIV